MGETNSMADPYTANFKTNISDKEITPSSAAEILSKTGAGPDDTNWSAPRCYEQCVSADLGGPGKDEGNSAVDDDIELDN